MPLDPSIFQALGTRPKSAFDYLQEMAQADDAGQRREMNKLTLLTQRGTFQDQQQARGIRNAGLSAVQGLGGSATDEQRISALRSAGDYTTADTLEKSLLERRKTGAQVEKDTAAAEKDKLANLHGKIDRHLQNLAMVNDPQAASAWVSEGVKMGVMDMQKASALLNQFRVMDPQQFQAWKQQSAQAGLSLKDQVEQQWKAKDFGLREQTQAETGRHNVVTEGLTARGQNMVDSRARDTLDQGKTPAGYRRGADGNLEFIPGGPADPSNALKSAKPLQGSVVKQLTEARDNAATIDRLTEAFKPEFASKGVLGLGADASLAAKGVFGSDAETVDWWKNYRKQAELVERHSLFGAALTPTEQASWRSADISPGMDAKVIQRNLATRQALTAKVFDNTRQDLIDAGNSEERVNAISKRDTKLAPKGAPKAGDVEQGYRFKGGNPADAKNWEKV